MLIRSKSESIWQLALLGLFTGLGTEVRFEIGLLLLLSFLALWFSRREERGLPRQPLNHPATPRPTPLPMLKSDGPLTAALRLDTPQPAARHFSRSRQFRPSIMLHCRTTRSMSAGCSSRNWLRSQGPHRDLALERSHALTRAADSCQWHLAPHRYHCSASSLSAHRNPV